MTERDDGPWQAASVHDDAPGDGDLAGDDPPTTRADDVQRVVLLDRVSGSAPTDFAPRRGDAAAGGVVVVATGADADRVRKLCHAHGLLVPVMATLAVVHDAMSVVVIGEPSPPAPERVVHVVRPALPDDLFVELLRALASGRAIVEPPAATTVASAASTSDPTVVEAARRLASVTDRAAIESITSDVIVGLTSADRAHCLFHDPVTGALWSEARRRGGGDARHAMSGLVGWAAQTGQTIHASPAGDDPRWLQELDDPDGKPQSRLLVQPIIGADRRVHAVLVAVRRWRHADFSDREQQALAAFAALAGPALDLAIAASQAPSQSPPRSQSPAQSPPRTPRSTLPGAMGPAPAMSPSSKSAVVVTPRAASDSRPPPVTARAGSGTAPIPIVGKRPAASLVPLVEEATRVDESTLDEPRPDERYSSESITSLPSPPSIARPGAPRPPSADPRSGPIAVAGSDDRQVPTADERSGRIPLAGKPAPVTDKRSGPVPLAAKRSGAARAATGSDARTDKHRRHQTSRGRATSEPRDLAVVANPDDAKRIDRIAKKARVELSTFGKLADAPEFYEVITIGETWSPTSDARIAYAARSTITDDQLADLLVGLTSGRAVAPAPVLTSAQSTAEARRSQLAFAAARKLAAATDLATAEEIATTTLHDLLDIDRAYCLFADPDSGALWSERRRRAGGDDRRAIAGIAGWVARTGRTANVARASADPRYLAPLDDPGGDPNSQLLLQPLVRSDDRVHGVLVAVRRPRRPGFTETDVALLTRFAALAAPLFEQLAVYLDTQLLVGEDTSTPSPLPAAPDPLWLAIVRGRHPLARWIFLALGLLVGLIIGLLA